MLAMLVAALFWSTSGLLIKVISLDALSLAGWRSGIAGITLLVIARAVGIRVGIPYDLRSWLAAVCYALILLLFVAATKMTTAANAIFLQYTAPVYVLVLEPAFLGTRFRWRDAGFVALAMAGMSLFFLGRIGAGDWRGNIAALASGVAFGLFALLTRAAQQNSRGRWEGVVWGNFLLLAGMIAFFLAGSAFFSGPTSVPLPRSGSEVAGVLFLGIVQIGCAYALFMYSILRLPALETMLFAMLEPVLNPVWVYLGTGEAPSRWALLGGALIIGSVTTRTWLEQRSR